MVSASADLSSFIHTFTHSLTHWSFIEHQLCRPQTAELLGIGFLPLSVQPRGKTDQTWHIKRICWN